MAEETLIRAGRLKTLCVMERFPLCPKAHHSESKPNATYARVSIVVLERSWRGHFSTV
jgi:hypothetical protein